MTEVVFRDECFKNLFYAQEAMKDWIPMTEYEMIFEATEKPEVASKVEQNEKTAEKSVGFLRKAIDAVIGLIKKLYEAVKDLIDRCTMNGDERKAFEQFKEAMAKDPSLKNKKVTVADFRKINEQYDSLIAEIDQNIRAVENDPSRNIDGLTKKIADFTKGAVTEVSVVVAADAALKMADSNVEMAKMIKAALKTEQGLMEGLTKALGKKGASKFQKEIDAAAKNTILHRLKVSLLRHKYNTARECIMGTIRTLTHEGFNNAQEISAELKRLKDDYKAGNITKAEYNQLKSHLETEKKRAKKESLGSLEMDKKILDTEHAGTAVKKVVKTAASAKVDYEKEKIAKKASNWVQDHVTDRNRKKRDKQGEYKRAGEFLSS